MFGEQFYPTPKELAKEIISPYISWKTLGKSGFKILDPSAGKGDFLEAALELGMDKIKSNDRITWQRRDRIDSEKANIAHAIEIDGNLQAVLLNKGFNVLDDDFLNHYSRTMYNLVIMNPPFANGVDHLLHAWEHLLFDNLVCILNAETIKNPYSAKRKQLINIIEDNNFKVEFKQHAFSDAERKTDVEVAIIHMKKEVSESLFDTIESERTTETKKTFNEINMQELAKQDTIKSIVDHYNATIDEYIEYRKAARKMNKLNGFWRWGNYSLSHEDSARDNATQTDRSQFEAYKERLTGAAWNTVFAMTNFESRMTEKVRKEFEANRLKAGQMAFTEKNIYTILELLIANSGQIALDCVLEVFDDFTRYHECNRVYFEGWKTNDAYEVGKKVILPGVVEIDFNHNFQLRYHYVRRMEDVDRAMSFVAGVDFNKILGIKEAISKHALNCTNQLSDAKDEFESEFFKIRCFKKGTMHLVFKDEEIRSRFNRIVSKERGWLKAWDGKNKRNKTKNTTSKDLVLWS